MVSFMRSLFALGTLCSLAYAQCSNNVAVYNPNLRTLSSNSTWFIVPVPKAAVLTAIKEALPLQDLTLLDVPTSDATLFPNGFPAGAHPVLVSIGYQDDTRMSALQIDGPLLSAQIYATYVSQSGSGPVAVSLNFYIAGPDGPLPNGLIPAVASPLLFGGNPIRLGQFRPEDAAYASEDGSIFSAQAKWAVVPNPVSGPGVYVEAADAEFQTIQAASSKYTAKTFKYLVNQPSVLPSGLCQRNAYYYNNATAMPVFRNGQVTLGPGADGAGPTSGALMQASADKSGVYKDVDGYSACAQSVGYNIQDCKSAVAQVDPSTYN